MIGILIVTHGKMATEVLNSAELIVGKQENVAALCLNPGDDVVSFGGKVSEVIEKFNKDMSVLILTDLFGGTPSNVVASYMAKFQFRCLTGVNLPMLIEAIAQKNNANSDLDYIAEECFKSGLAGIKNLNNILKGGDQCGNN